MASAALIARECGNVATWQAKLQVKMDFSG
jgi:hypothetical protein